VYSPLSGTPDTTLTFQLGEQYDEVTLAGAPLPLTFVVYGFAVDAQGKCGVSVSESLQALQCNEIGVPPAPGAGFFLTEGQTGKVYAVTAVAGTSVGLPAGTIIADAVPDPKTDRVYLSNFGKNEVEVINISQRKRSDTPLLVGSQPWGMFLSPPGPGNPTETLLVANSGGTNISFVSTAQLRETNRLLTPSQQLFEVGESQVDGFRRYTTGSNSILAFSDRPQFIAQDTNGLILYSTKPTSANRSGTIRKVIPAALLPAGVRSEPTILLTDLAYTDATDRWALSNIDSVFIVPGAAGADGEDDAVRLIDHVPGDPTAKLTITGSLADSLFVAFRAMGSDVQGRRGGFNVAGFALHDTTYVAASGDRRTVAFGEGAVGPFGRIFQWNASTIPGSPELGTLTSQGTTDLINNAAERVLGVALSQNGQLGVGRGVLQTYFFSNNVAEEGFLRLQGVFSNGVAGGNGGVALHPNHSEAIPVNQDSSETAVAFIATGNRSIKIVDTFHFFERGEIAIRDNIVGQLRAAIPAASENGSLPPTSCDYVSVQLYGVTSTNNLVIVNVRRRDILPNCQ
jgi:hypothetical protein